MSIVKKFPIEKKTEVLRCRVDSAQFSRVRALADLYADGDISEWLRYAALNAPPVQMKPSRRTSRRGN